MPDPVELDIVLMGEDQRLRRHTPVEITRLVDAAPATVWEDAERTTVLTTVQSDGRGRVNGYVNEDTYVVMVAGEPDSATVYEAVKAKPGGPPPVLVASGVSVNTTGPGGIIVSESGGGGSSNSGHRAFYFNPEWYERDGYDAQFRFLFVMLTNNFAPGTDFTAGLSTFSSPSGSGVLGGAVPVSDADKRVTFAAAELVANETHERWVDFDLQPEGWYALRISWPGPLPANAVVALRANLYVVYA